MNISIYFFCALSLFFSNALFAQNNPDSLSKKTKNGHWVQDPRGRYGFESNYASISQWVTSFSLNTEIASTITNSLSIGGELQFKHKITPIFHIGIGCNIGYTVSYDNPLGKNYQIKLPDHFGEFNWEFYARAPFVHPKVLLGGAFSIPEQGNRFRFSWETSVGYRASTISSVDRWNLYAPTPNVKGDRWYEKGTNFSALSISGGLRANYFWRHHVDIFAQISVSAVSNQTVYALRETFDYENGKLGGMGGVLSLQTGFAFSFEGFGNFYHPSGGKLSNKHLAENAKELAQEKYLDSLNALAGLYVGILINDGAEITRSKDGNVKLSLFHKDAKMVMISTSIDFEGAVWIPYVGVPLMQIPFTLPFGNEEKTIHVKFKDANGIETERYSDSIIQMR